MTDFPLVAVQRAADTYKTADAAALEQLTLAVAQLADVVTALQGTLAVDTGLTIPTPQTDALTNVQLRASAVPVFVARDQADLGQSRSADGTEVRYDLGATDTYIGAAVDGSTTSAAVWTVVRYYLDTSGNPTRKRTRTGVAWDSRTSGWS